MLETFKQLIGKQYEASLCALHECIDRCPDAAWDAPVANLAFCQAAFHVLFFTDLYLGPNVESLREQPFHRANSDAFRDYEELEPRRQQLLYDRAFLKHYLQHCRHKAAEVVAAETLEMLQLPAGFDWLKFPRAELHVYNIRHIQHHAAQLMLRLRIDFAQDFRWVGSGWREA